MASQKGVAKMAYRKSRSEKKRTDGVQRWWRWISGAAIIACLLLAGILGRGATHADGAMVVINELMWMGSANSSADEWIELRNTSDHVIDISGWTITKKSSGAESAMLTIPVGKSISAGGFFIISNYPNTNSSTTLNVVPDYVTTDVALSNSALQIKLYDATHTVVDTADDGIGNPLAGDFDSAKKIYASMERNPDPGDGTVPQNWHSASRALGFKTDTVEKGTPGTVNSNGLPTAHAGPDQTGTVGQEVNFDGSDSIDPENQPLTYAWTFGDGAMDSVITPTHAFSIAGAYTVTLVVSDGVDSSSDTMNVVVQNAVTPAAIQPSSPSPASPEAGSGVVAPIGSCAGLRISEILPNPVGIDSGEFIELVNDGDEDVLVGGCAVGTNATKTYKLPVGTTIPLHGFFLLPKSQTHLTLNNTGTSVRLLETDGTELDRVNYETAKEGESWSIFGDAWSWTTKSTPNAANVFAAAPTSTSTKKTVPSKKITTKEKSPVKSKVVPPAEHVTLAQVQELDSGDRVIVSGVVTVPRDALGSTVAYIQTTEGGVSVSIPNGEPTVKLGQHIEVTGTVRLKNGRRYVSAATKGVVPAATIETPQPTVMPTDDIGPDNADQLVHIAGLVALSSGNSIEVDDGSGPVSIYLKSSTGIVKPKIKAGDTVEATGIVGVSTSGVRVLPRSQEDLHVEKILGAATSSVAQVVTAPAASKNQTLWYWLLVVLGGVVASVKPLWKTLKTRKRVESRR